MNWQTPNIRTGTILDLINQSFLKLQGRNAYSFPNLRHFPTLIMTSDYSGESHDAPYLVYSFLITSLDGWIKVTPIVKTENRVVFGVDLPALV